MVDLVVDRVVFDEVSVLMVELRLFCCVFRLVCVDFRLVRLVLMVV